MKKNQLSSFRFSVGLTILLILFGAGACKKNTGTVSDPTGTLSTATSVNTPSPVTAIKSALEKHATFNQSVQQILPGAVLQWEKAVSPSDDKGNTLVVVPLSQNMQGTAVAILYLRVWGQQYQYQLYRKTAISTLLSRNQTEAAIALYAAFRYFDKAVRDIPIDAALLPEAVRQKLQPGQMAAATLREGVWRSGGSNARSGGCVTFYTMDDWCFTGLAGNCSSTCTPDNPCYVYTTTTTNNYCFGDNDQSVLPGDVLGGGADLGGGGTLLTEEDIETTFNVDCNTFAFKKTTTSNWQEAGVNKIRLKWVWIGGNNGGLTREIYINHIVVGMPIDYISGTHVTPGEAANKAARVLEFAKRQTYRQFNSYATYPDDNAIISYFKATLHALMSTNYSGTAGVTGSGSANIIFRDEERSNFSDPYDCD
jgi:hypothetical protein